MPILGIIASSITGSTLTSYESISTVTVGGGGSASVSFTSIPATYTHLQVRAIVRTTSASNPNLAYKLNNDTSNSNYRYHQIIGTGATISGEYLAAGTSNSFIIGNDILSLSGDLANTFGTMVLDIIDYTNTNKYKTVRNLFGKDLNGSGAVALASSLWSSTAAVNRIDFNCISDNLAQYSQFALYGVRA